MSKRFADSGQVSVSRALPVTWTRQLMDVLGRFFKVFAIQTELAVPVTQTALVFDARGIDYVGAGQQMCRQPAQQLGREPCADAEANLCNQEHQEYEVHDVSSLWAARSTVNGQEVGVLEWRVIVLNGEKNQKSAA